MSTEPPNPPNPNPNPGEQPKVVAYENFQRVVEAKTGLEAQLKTAQSQIQALQEKAATVDTLSGQVNEWKNKATEAEGRFATFSEFSGALGTNDSEIIGVFDAKYKALPEKDRPSRTDWVGILKAKPDGAPSVLRPWLTGGVGNTTVGGPPKPAPKPPNTPPTPPSAPSSVSPEEIARVREEAVRTGDWSKWKEMRKGMGLG